MNNIHGGGVSNLSLPSSAVSGKKEGWLSAGERRRSSSGGYVSSLRARRGGAATPWAQKSPSFLPCFSAVRQERKAGGGGGGCNISVCVPHHFSPRERPETAGPINEDLWWRKLPGERVISRRDAALIASTACYWHLETVGLLPRRFIPCQPCVQGRSGLGQTPSLCRDFSIRPKLRALWAVTEVLCCLNATSLPVQMHWEA